MTLDFSVLLPYWHLFLNGALVTVKASLFGVLIGTAGGLFVGAFRVLPFAPLRWLAWLYISVLRGTPLMVQLFLIYFGLPELGVNLDAFLAGVLGIGINSSAYVGEIVRGGIESILRGQWEAAKVLGLSYWQSLWTIIMPQAVRSMLPAIGNEFVALIKESSLLSVLAISDLTQAGQQVRSVTYASFESFIVVGLVYLFLTSAATGALSLLEKKWHTN